MQTKIDYLQIFGWFPIMLWYQGMIHLWYHTPLRKRKTHFPIQ